MWQYRMTEQGIEKRERARETQREVISFLDTNNSLRNHGDLQAGIIFAAGVNGVPALID